jgi:hypothetical protein
VNTIQRVRIIKAHAYDLIGEVEAGGLEASTAAYEKSFERERREGSTTEARKTRR